MTIVCGTDFSNASREAASVAASLARRRAEPLLLVHSAPYAGFDHEKLQASIEAEASALRTAGLLVSTELRFGWPDEDIDEVAEAANASLIVLGAVGHRAGARWPIGNLPGRVAQRVRRPLLVVRDRSSLEAWLAGNSNATFALGTDISPSSLRVLEEASRMAALGKTKVVLTYVINHPAEYERLHLSGPIYHRRVHPVVEEVISSGLKEQIRTISGAESVEARYPMTLDRTADSLVAVAGETQAALIIVGAHQRQGLSRLWHGSVADDVLHGASTNVLIVPLRGAEEHETVLRPPEVNSILAATDFSAGGDRALAWARGIAPPNARLVFVTVVGEEAGRATATGQLRQRAEALQLDNASCEVLVSKDVAAALAAAAERFGAQIICVGASGDGGTAHPFFGSVARALLTRSRVPVLAVKEA